MGFSPGVYKQFKTKIMIGPSLRLKRNSFLPTISAIKVCKDYDSL